MATVLTERDGKLDQRQRLVDLRDPNPNLTCAGA